MNQTTSLSVAASEGQMANAPSSLASRTRQKFNLVVGGSVGNDPYDSRTWSGSALGLLHALKQVDALDHAIGLQLPLWKDAALKVSNFSPSRQVWRLKFYLDSAYRTALTESAAKMNAVLESRSPFLQIGAMYSLPRATRHRVSCFSYHDGNIVEAVKSGYGFDGIRAMRIDEAIRYERDVAQEMTSIFTCSEYLRRSFIQDFGLPENRVFNVGAGVNIDDIPPCPYGKNYEKKNILFVGVDFVRKGGNELLTAFRTVHQIFPDASLHIVGPHQKPYQGEQPGVAFHGHLRKQAPAQKDALYSLYNDASLFVLPSNYEPFGIAPLEAMLFQVPCIVTDGWAMREFVTPGVNGALVQKGSVENLIGALLAMLKSPEQLERMGKSGREMVLNQYVWPAVVSRMKRAAAMQ
jgi:alpha-maltose-1-phosphate synthase